MGTMGVWKAELEESSERRMATEKREAMEATESMEEMREELVALRAWKVMKEESDRRRLSSAQAQDSNESCRGDTGPARGWRGLQCLQSLYGGLFSGHGS